MVVPVSPDAVLPAEQRARELIDGQLTAAGWLVQDPKHVNLYAGQGVAVREAVMAPGHCRADHLLYVDQRAVGVIEAKPEGTPLSGVEWAFGDLRHGPGAAGPVEGCHSGGSVAVRVLGLRLGDPLHQRVRPDPQGPRRLSLSPP